MVREGVFAFFQPRGRDPRDVGVGRSLGEARVRVGNLGVGLRPGLLGVGLLRRGALEPLDRLRSLLDGARAVVLERLARRAKLRAFAFHVLDQGVAPGLGLPGVADLVQLVGVHPLDVSRRLGPSLVALALARLERAPGVLERALSLRGFALDIGDFAHALAELGSRTRGVLLRLTRVGGGGFSFGLDSLALVPQALLAPVQLRVLCGDLGRLHPVFLPVFLE